MKIKAHIGGKALSTSYYTFNILDTEDYFTVSTKLISIKSLKNTPENLNGLSLGKTVLLQVKNENVIKMINSPDLSDAGVALLRKIVINKYRL